MNQLRFGHDCPALEQRLKEIPAELGLQMIRQLHSVEGHPVLDEQIHDLDVVGHHGQDNRFHFHCRWPSHTIHDQCGFLVRSVFQQEPRSLQLASLNGHVQRNHFHLRRIVMRAHHQVNIRPGGDEILQRLDVPPRSRCMHHGRLIPWHNVI